MRVLQDIAVEGGPDGGGLWLSLLSLILNRKGGSMKVEKPSSSSLFMGRKQFIGKINGLTPTKGIIST